MLRTLDEAQKALHKFEVDEVSLTENDLGNVTIRWVLLVLEAKVNFLLKGDLKKHEQILAKLATLS